MITKDDISQISNNTLCYCVDDICIQYDLLEDCTEQQMDDAAQQFALILSLAAWDKNLGRNIERHMTLNGYKGTADWYESH